MLLLSVPAFGASKLEASREAAGEARSRLEGLRDRQASLRSELDRLAGQIEALKAEHKGKLLRGDQLQSALRRSQELSGSLTSLAREVSVAEEAADRENLSYLAAISEELSRLRAEFDRLEDREARKQIISRMRSLRAEREKVRGLLPPASVPALESPTASDDPEDLLEQVDALRDTEDKVRRELKALEARIAEKREERELDRRMGEFLGDESIFDDNDRRLRLKTESVERERTTTADDGIKAFGAGAPAPKTESGTAAAAPPSDSTPSFGSVDTNARDVNQSEKAPMPQVTETVVTRSARASDARPTVGTGREKSIASGGDEDLEDLEIQRARLKGVMEEVKLRASKLEEKARSLK
ncbi:MAG: TetR family transcriptional regulator [Myxococcales bacterium]|nr:TetR family transcriptional regulator [Myxococcales bacterium]